MNIHPNAKHSSLGGIVCILVDTRLVAGIAGRAACCSDSGRNGCCLQSNIFFVAVHSVR